ncbi:MAG: HD-GYP domain-containing protein [Clostridia bacterium]
MHDSLILKEIEESSQLAKAYILFESLYNKDKDTGEHSLNVAFMQKIFLQEYYEADDGYVETGFICGLLHDIGKLRIPDAILKSCSSLTKSERELITKHSLYSSNILKRMRFSGEIINAAVYHHERWDGSGYPYALRKNEIPFLARVLGIIDSFCALTEDRTYREKLSTEEAIQILKNERYLYDEKILNLFFMNIDVIINSLNHTSKYPFIT